jgi:head-tail adaptor
MGLLPHPVAVAELEVTDNEREQIAADIDLRLRLADDPTAFKRLRVTTSECLIEQVELFAKDEMRKLILFGEESNLELEMSAKDDSLSVRESQK